MSWVMVSPELVVAAAADLAGIGSAISSANAAAAVNTTGLLTAGADEVSTAIAALFGAQGQAYQAASAQAAAFYAQPRPPPCRRCWPRSTRNSWRPPGAR
ncbi:PE-PGRS family protein [Mycobacterium tuberculosis]|nr:PE family protein [Mycobacterium tuberculosis]CKP08057.1 PE-PGRS family protein [Mycobacterium tuberculosis]